MQVARTLRRSPRRLHAVRLHAVPARFGAAPVRHRQHGEPAVPPAAASCVAGPPPGGSLVQLLARAAAPGAPTRGRRGQTGGGRRARQGEACSFSRRRRRSLAWAPLSQEELPAREREKEREQHKYFDEAVITVQARLLVLPTPCGGFAYTALLCAPRRLVTAATARRA